MLRSSHRHWAGRPVAFVACNTDKRECVSHCTWVLTARSVGLHVLRGPTGAPTEHFWFLNFLSTYLKRTQQFPEKPSSNFYVRFLLITIVCEDFIIVISRDFGHFIIAVQLTALAGGPSTSWTDRFALTGQHSCLPISAPQPILSVLLCCVFSMQIVRLASMRGPATRMISLLSSPIP